MFTRKYHRKVMTGKKNNYAKCSTAVIIKLWQVQIVQLLLSLLYFRWETSCEWTVNYPFTTLMLEVATDHTIPLHISNERELAKVMTEKAVCECSRFSKKCVKYFFFSIWVFFHAYSRFTGQQGKRQGIYLTPLYHFHPLYRHLDIRRAITAERSPLRIASSRTRTGNLCFPSASR